MSRYPKLCFHDKPSLCVISVLGHAPVLTVVQGRGRAEDVKAEKVQTRVHAVLIQHYLLFSLTREFATAKTKQPLSFSVWKKVSCIVALWLRLPSDTLTPSFHTRLGLFCWVRYTLDEFGTARRCAVVRGFIDALTRGGPGGTPRPIEMHSHDPMRYFSVPVWNCYQIGGEMSPHPIWGFTKSWAQANLSLPHGFILYQAEAPFKSMYTQLYISPMMIGWISPVTKKERRMSYLHSCGGWI